MGDEVIEQVAAEQLHRAKFWYRGFIVGSLGFSSMWVAMVENDPPTHMEHNEIAQRFFGKKWTIWKDVYDTDDPYQALAKHVNNMMTSHFDHLTRTEKAEWMVGFMDGVLSSAKWSGLR